MVIIPKHQKYGPLICVSIKNVNLYYQNFVYYWDENFCSQSFLCQCSYFVGNKAKGQISKQVFQENDARQIFRKTDIPYPMIRTCAYQGVRNFHFSENLTSFVFLKHLFWDLPFCLITDDLLQCLSVFCSKCTANQMTSFYMKCNFGPDWGITEASLFQFLSLLIPNLVFTRLSIRRIKTWQRIEASVLTHFMLYCPSRDIFPKFFQNLFIIMTIKCTIHSISSFLSLLIFLFFNPLSANPTKSSDTLKQFVGNLPRNRLSVFGHFMVLALKRLRFIVRKKCCLEVTRSYVFYTWPY